RCLGVCRPMDALCETYPAPDPAACAGEWIRAGRDEIGCPLPPVCQCRDGTQSFDGSCAERCGNVECTAPPVCGPDERLEIGFPFCCGICVPADQCLFEPFECDPAGSCGPTDELACVSGLCLPAGAACPEVSCDSDSEIVPGPGCCPTCAPKARYCTASEQCVDGELCTTEFGECQLDPACEDGNTDMPCSPECFGVCEPLP
ncbi:MAG: hypothetical protein AAFQ82_06845, partial [Myxococcota bacterium]